MPHVRARALSCAVKSHGGHRKLSSMPLQSVTIAGTREHRKAEHAAHCPELGPRGIMHPARRHAVPAKR